MGNENPMKCETAAAKVIVVGGGVSGCACAARLSCLGANVVVISSALDVVGLPGYGPNVEAAEGGWPEMLGVFSQLPAGLRWAWLGSAWVLESGDPTLVVDRRAVSVETKRCLERMHGISFRQGLVVGVRHLADAIEVETAFGEVFEADLVVLAPGLALRGEMVVGDDRPAGGRYGEVPANELHSALAELGMRFREVEIIVGAHLSDAQARVLRGQFSGTGQQPGTARVDKAVRCLASEGAIGEENLGIEQGTSIGAEINLVSLTDLVNRSSRPNCAQANLEGGPLAEVLRAMEAVPGENTTFRVWPEGFPYPPYWTEELSHPAVLASVTSASDPTGPSPEPWLSPDGVTLSEHYLSPPRRRVGGGERQQPTFQASEEEGAWEATTAGMVASRLEYSVKAFVVERVDEGGRTGTGLQRIRVAGRCAGAHNYLESLVSGTRVADSAMADYEDWRRSGTLDDTDTNDIEAKAR